MAATSLDEKCLRLVQTATETGSLFIRLNKLSLTHLLQVSTSAPVARVQTALPVPMVPATTPVRVLQDLRGRAVRPVSADYVCNWLCLMQNVALGSQHFLTTMLTWNRFLFVLSGF